MHSHPLTLPKVALAVLYRAPVGCISLSLIFHFLLVSKSCFYCCLPAFVNLIIYSTNIYRALYSVSDTMLTSGDTMVNKTDLHDPCLLICSPVWPLIALTDESLLEFRLSSVSSHLNYCTSSLTDMPASV